MRALISLAFLALSAVPALAYSEVVRNQRGETIFECHPGYYWTQWVTRTGYGAGCPGQPLSPVVHHHRHHGHW